MLSVSADDQKIINALNANWVWVPDWTDAAKENTAGRIVRFTRHFDLGKVPSSATVYFTADTRYKFYVNGKRVAVGPSRCGPTIWYYDQLDLAQYLKPGKNALEFVVLRYFASSRAAMPFERTTYPGLTVHGVIETDSARVDLNSRECWLAQVDDSIAFPTGLVDDGFLHVS